MCSRLCCLRLLCSLQKNWSSFPRDCLQVGTASVTTRSRGAVSRLADRAEPKGHVVLILDKVGTFTSVRLPLLHRNTVQCGLLNSKGLNQRILTSTSPSFIQHLQKLPWECVLCLRPCSVTRMPSLHSLLGHCIQREVSCD